LRLLRPYSVDIAIAAGIDTSPIADDDTGMAARSASSMQHNAHHRGQAPGLTL
jgi:hypothetical protein